MKSIRLNLVVYFLLLLVVALGAVSALVYGITYRAIQDKEASTQHLLQAQYEQRKDAIKEDFDNRILRRAQTLANLAKSQWIRQFLAELNSLGLLGAMGNPNAYALVPLWGAEGVPSRVSWSLYRRGSTKIMFADEVLAQGRVEGDREYFEIFSDTGIPLQRSKSMRDAQFKLDPAVSEHLDLLEWHFDDTHLRPGVPVRRVTLRAPVTLRQLPPPLPPNLWLRPPRNNPSDRKKSTANATPARQGNDDLPKGPPRIPPKAPPPFRSTPFAFIQCAYDITQRDGQIQIIAAKEQQDLDDLKAESSNRLASLRRDLLWICLGTLGASLLGGFLVVGLGLSPLQHLSEAVSHVSEKNFRLPLDEATVPVELRPIISRLQQSLELLGRAFAREKQAAADISHELRTPVAALVTAIEVALRRPRSSEEYREVLDECRTGVQQIGHLVERLLALARLDAGADHLRPTRVNATALAEQCAALVRPLAEARGLALNVHASQPVTLTADPDKLREVVTNLLHNAIQYNRPNGVVDLTVERVNGSLCLEVRDTGVGIAPEAREQIFERFVRADAARQSDGVHAGLGLAIVEGYVELMGGSIAVESTVQKGSKFAVRIPIEKNAAVVRSA